MKRPEYVEKTKQLLKDDTIYRAINKDPITALQKTITLMLMKWKNHKFITDSMYQILKPENCNLARNYCVPKIHKNNYPLRPIVSSINCPTYKIANFIHKYISERLHTYKSEIKHSFSFKKLVQDIKRPDGHVLISSDVTALYTNVHIKLVMNSLEKRRNLFEEDMFIDELRKAIDFIMNSTYFTFENIIYKQIARLPMGSPLAPILWHKDKDMQNSRIVLEKILNKKFF